MQGRQHIAWRTEFLESRGDVDAVPENVIALDDDVPVQRVDYARLRKRLLADQQRLDWP